MRIQTNSNNVQKAVATERDRVALRDILRAKGKTVADNASLQSLIAMVNSVGINDEFKKMCEGNSFEIVDTEGIITSFTNCLQNTAKANITKVSLPKCALMKYTSISGATSLTELSLPKCQVFEDASVSGLSNLTNVVLSDTITSIGYNFLSSSKITSLELGNVGFVSFGFLQENSVIEKISFKSIGNIQFSSGTTHSCLNCSSLKLFDVGNCSQLTQGYNNDYLMRGLANFKAFVIRTPDAVTPINGTAIFKWLNANLTGWYIYIPYALHTSSGYAAANNWSSVASTYATNNNGADVFKSIQENLVDLLSYGMDITEYYDIVESLPTSNIDDTIVYLIETATAGTYEQHFHGSGSWEQLANITLPAS